MTDNVTQENGGTIKAPAASKPETDAEEYVVFPRDGHDEPALAATEQLLKQLTHPPGRFLAYRDFNNKLLLWLIKVTEAQAKEIEKQEGVERIEKERQIAEAQAK